MIVSDVGEDGVEDRQVGTVGWIKAQPGAYNVIPGKVTMGMELRDLDAGKIKDLFERSREAADEIGRANGTIFHFSSEDLSAPALTELLPICGAIGAICRTVISTGSARTS